MRETWLHAADGRRAVLRTGDTGTVLQDDEGMVLASHGTDRHEEMLERLRGEGWGIGQDADRRPAEAGPADAPPDGPAGPAGEVDLGSAG
jgi:hypothetical protein